ncbi:T6SS immunity protein Tli4 family protein [Chitinimonas taiwanensis]|uniref:Tle cognate immunity protein 4 C-terminal domain-containing protein n=1 Tax=Chitinimonas taiwanensis DSM 18899 TaxID=1121279 RepID=A0A1K2HRS1_9NEIS|nr:T6SS immunity protein Tli4 family protein [Chitinimonas taiwanensis]SFZ79471.1 hypothetical protein SAMN02745887_03653 [Chitinimonas taiwanensis DSM 18899]
MRLRILYLWFGIVFPSICTAYAGDESHLPLDWRNDCVGRMQLSLPNNVDIAAMFPKELIRKLDVNRRNWDYHIPYGFEDGSEYGWSSFDYAGELQISLPADERELSQIWINASGMKRQNGIYLKKHHKPFYEIEKKDRARLAWSGESFQKAIFEVGQSVVFWQTRGEPEDQSLRIQRYQKIASGLRSRPLMTSPTEPGVCLPYAFIRDDDAVYRSIATVYRLKEHPDVIVRLIDRNADPIEPPSLRRPETYSASYKLNDFWSQYAAREKSYKSVWFPAGRDVSLTGYKGKAAFVEITRADGSLDYGYTIAVRGNPDATEDTPDLFFSVMRYADAAKVRDIEPISKDELLKLAETIAASVKRRPVVK